MTTQSFLRRVLLALLTLLLIVPAGTALGQDRLPNSEQPLPNTARVLDGYVYGMDRVGDIVVVGGDFSTVRDYAFGSPDMTRNHLFAFDMSTGEVIDAFAPIMDDVVHAVHIVDEGQNVLVAGEFKDVNGVRQRGIAKLSLADGSLVTSFSGQTSSAVLDMAVAGDVVYVGGRFDWAGGVRRPRLAAMDLNSGAGIAAFDFPLSGIVNPTAQDVQSTTVLELDTSPDGRWLAVVGNQTHVAGQPRGQVALIDLQDFTLADWSIPQFGTWPCSTSRNKLTYVMTLEFAPDSSYLVTGTMGAYRQPETDALCDSIARFEVPPVATGAVRPTWTNYTGGDSIFRVQVTEAAVYAGGHQRWVNNPYPTTATGSRSGDRDGVGSVLRPGIAALDPTSGVPLSWYPNRDGARPVRGFEEIIADGSTLLLGSDSSVIGGEIRQRVAAYSTEQGPTNPRPEVATLPVNLLSVQEDGRLSRTSFDGATFGQTTQVSGPGVDDVVWSNVGDGFVQHGRLVYFGEDDAYYRRSLDEGQWGDDLKLSTSVGYVDDGTLTPYDQPRNVDVTEAAAYVGGRIVYTRSGNKGLWWRWYSLESGIINPQEFQISSGRDWSTASAMTVIGERLYVVQNGSLSSYALQADYRGVRVDDASQVVLSTDQRWSSVRGLFTTLADDMQAPSVSMSTPEQDGAALPSAITVTGQAEDDRGLARVEVEVTNASGAWLQQDGTFAADIQSFQIELDGRTSDWSLELPDLPVGEGYSIAARAVDEAGNVTAPDLAREFRVVTGQPVTTIDSPSARQSLTEGPVTISGTAKAELAGIDRVEVTLRNTQSGAWLQPDGTFASGFARIRAAVANPGATASSWSVATDLPPGEWAVTARTVSASGTVESAGAWTPFSTVADIDDTTAPNTVIEAPAAWSTSPSGAVTFSGVSTDDNSGVASVFIAVRNVDTGVWLRRDGSWGSFQWIPAAVDEQSTTSTSWQYQTSLPAGRWWVEGRSVDVVGNTELDRTGLRFDTTG